MILKSYFRKKSTKLYICLFTVIITSILIVNSYISYLNNIRETSFIRSEIVFSMTDEDIYKILKKNKNIVNLEEVILFGKDDNNTFIDDNRTHDKLQWGDFTLYELNQKKWYYSLVYSAKNKNLKLKDNEIIINYSNNMYPVLSSYFDNYIGKKINFNFNNKEISFKIKDVVNVENNNIFYISDNLFQKLKKNQKKYVYTFNVKNDDILYDVIKLIENDYKGERHEFGLEQIDEDADRKLKTFIIILTITNYILIISFVFIMSIISKNIMLDLNKSIKLEKRLGYDYKQMKNNVFIRLFYTHLLSFLISMVIYVPLIFIINNLFSIKLSEYNNLILLTIFIYTILYDYISSRKIHNI